MEIGEAISVEAADAAVAAVVDENLISDISRWRGSHEHSGVDGPIRLCIDQQLKVAEGFVGDEVSAQPGARRVLADEDPILNGPPAATGQGSGVERIFVGRFAPCFASRVCPLSRMGRLGARFGMPAGDRLAVKQRTKPSGRGVVGETLRGDSREEARGNQG